MDPADDVADQSEGGKDAEFHQITGGAIQDRDRIKQGDQGDIVEIIQLVHADDRRQDRRTEQPQHCCHQEEHGKSAAQGHGMFAAVEPAGCQETEPAHGEHHQKSAQIQQQQFLRIQPGFHVHRVQADNAGHGRAGEHQQQRTGKIECLRKGNCPAFC